MDDFGCSGEGVENVDGDVMSWRPSLLMMTWHPSCLVDERRHIRLAGDPSLPSVDGVAASIIVGIGDLAGFNCVGEDGITGR